MTDRPTVEVVTSAAGWTVRAEFFESREEAERVASILRFTLQDRRMVKQLATFAERQAKRSDVDRAMDLNGD